MADWTETHRGVVFPWHCDHLGHMNVRHYADPFNDARFHLWLRAGVPREAFERLGLTPVVARTATDYRKELKPGDLWVIESGFTRLGDKSVSLAHRMVNAETGAVCATQEGVEVIVALDGLKPASLPDDLRATLEAALVAGEDLARPGAPTGALPGGPPGGSVTARR